MQKLVPIFFGLYAASLMISIAGMEIFSWALFGIFLISVGMDLSSGKRIQVLTRDLKQGPDRALWIYFGVVVIGALFSRVKSESFLDILGYVRWIFLLYALSYLVRRHLVAKLERFAEIVIFTSGIVGLLAWFQFLSGDDPLRPYRPLLIYEDYFRARGAFNISLTYAYASGMAGMLGFGYLVLAKKEDWPRWKRFLIPFAVVSSCLGSIVTLSRGAWGALVFCAISISKVLSRRAFILTLVAMLLSAAVSISVSKTFRKKLASTVDMSVTSNSYRLNLWRVNWAIFKDHPVLGVGLGQNSYLVPEYYQKLGMTNSTFVGHAHSNYFQMLSGTGIIGFGAYLLFVFGFLRKAWRMALHSEVLAIRSLAMGIFLAQLFVHLGGFTECNFTDGEITHMMIFCWALLSGLEKREQSVLEKELL